MFNQFIHWQKIIYCNKCIRRNSICQHYVTEKFWFALRALTVPVVLKRSVLNGMDVPSNSFIAVDDFLSVKELVEHLKVLRNDVEEYLK